MKGAPENRRRELYKSLLEICAGVILDVVSLYLYEEKNSLFPLFATFGGWLIGDGFIRSFLDHYKKVRKYGKS